MLPLWMTCCCILFSWIPHSLQCGGGGSPPDNSALIASQQKAREQELKLWCHENCVSEWSPWSPCDSQCGRGKMQRTRVRANSEWCKLLKNFKCTQSTSQQGDCNAGCPFGGLTNNRKCTGCPRGRQGDCCQTEVFCPYPKRPTHGKVDGTWPAKPDTLAEFECNPGYNVVGDDLATCTRSGTWSNAGPKCEVIQCPTPIKNVNVKLLNEKPEGYAFGEQVVYDCDDGYTLIGERSRTCQRGITGTGVWSGYDTQCKAVKCPVPKIPQNGDIITTNTTFQYKNVVRFECDTGYKLIGSDALQCLASGAWFGHEPKCEAITCEAPFTPNHGQVRIRKAGVKSFAVFACDEGYRLEPNTRSLTCTEEGSWNSTEPQCLPASCEDPGTPENSYRDGGVFTFGNKVTFHCQRGYEMKGGSETIECQSNKQWSGSLPNCEACAVGFYMKGKLCSKCPANSKTATNASTSVVQCLCDTEEGFLGPPGGPCEEVLCTELEAPDNGKISECGNNVGDECDFTCGPGYVIERGSTRRTCQNTGEWDGTPPFCVPCKLNTYKSGERTCSPCPIHSHTDLPGQMLTGCLCDEGYGGDPGGPCPDINECLTNNGKGPCGDTCENNDGGYNCRCSIPGYKIDPEYELECIAAEQCKNLTRDDAPENGGVVCHWYYEENSQHCTTKCNPGFELPSRTNDYETCGPATSWTWSYRVIDPTALLAPCIPEFFPEFRLEGETSYFAAACEDLTDEQKNAAKIEFASRLNEKGVCMKRHTKLCNIKDMAIICGRTTRRRKRRGTETLEHSVDFAYNVSALQLGELTMDDCADIICPQIRLPAKYCARFCKKGYKRYLQASVEFAKIQLHDIHKNTQKLQGLNFNVDDLGFVAEEDGFRASDVIKECPKGMEAVDEQCVACEAGSYLNKDLKACVVCPVNFYQNKQRQYECIPCKTLGPGYSTSGNGSTTCQICPEGQWGEDCVNQCDCAHGSCSPFDGSCICTAGWEGPRCEKDINSCLPGSCFTGVTCIDQAPPATGYSCGPCPSGYHGDGITCTSLRKKRSLGLMAFEL